MKKHLILIPSIIACASIPCITMVGCDDGKNPRPDPALFDVVVDTYSTSLTEDNCSGIHSATKISIEPNHSYSICIDFKNYVDLQDAEDGWTLFCAVNLSEWQIINPFNVGEGHKFYVDGDQSKELVYGGCNIKNNDDSDYYSTAGLEFVFDKDSPKLSTLTQNNYLTGELKTSNYIEAGTYYFLFCEGWN